jgi:asparagine synthetase B (glutamine-hydrolysing)
MGIKPLYYAESGSYFLFASEVRTIIGTGLVPRRLDHAGVLNYLTFGSAYDPLTLIDGIRALPPGHSLIWEHGAVRHSAYWNLADYPDDDDHERFLSSTNERSRAAWNLRPILEEAVRLQLVSNVPVGVFLSGGIDSSALVSILSRSGVTRDSLDCFPRSRFFRRRILPRYRPQVSDRSSGDYQFARFWKHVPVPLIVASVTSTDSSKLVSGEDRNSNSCRKTITKRSQ